MTPETVTPETVTRETLTPAELDPTQARVIGSLGEKQLTTPQQYPLSLNALVLACNQTSNRDPIVAFDEGTVEQALASLKEVGLVRFVHPSHGRSVIRYRQVIDERFGLDDRGLSVLTVMLLRGPQTVGELRSRTERMADFSSLSEIESELDRLRDRPDPLVRQLQRQPGQKEERWVQLLTGPSLPPSLHHSPVPEPASTAPAGDPRDDLASVRAEVDALRQEVRTLRDAFEALRAALGD